MNEMANTPNGPIRCKTRQYC